jgi:hypothetical protein
MSRRSQLLGRDARRLLEALSKTGALPARTDLRDGFLAVAASRNGITSILANVPAPAGEELVSRGLARWVGEGAAKVLSILGEGRDHARRIAAEGADPFLAQHRKLRSASIGEAAVTLNDAESPLTWLARRKDKDGAPYLEPAHVAAGERFCRDVNAAGLLPRVTADWSGIGGSNAGRGPHRMNVGDIAIAARQRLDHAARAVGPDLHGLLVDVCGFQKGLEFVERERAWPPRSAKVVLRIALDRLASHYGLASQARGPDRAQKTLQWGAEDYRPTIRTPAELGG